MLIVGILVFIFGTTLSLIFKGIALSNLINPACIVFYLAIILAALATTSGFKLFAKGLNAAIFKKYHMPEDERIAAAGLFTLLGKITAFGAVATLALAIIAALGHMDDIEALGHAMASAFVGMYMGLVLTIGVFLPAAYAVRHGGAEAVRKGSVKAYPKALGDRLLELCYQQGLTAEEIEKATEINLHSESE